MNIRQRLGVITDEVSGNLVEALDWMKAEGLHYAEIRMVDGVNISNVNDEQAKRIVRETEQRGIAVSAVSSPLFKCALDPSREVASGDTFGQEEESVEEHFRKLARTIDIAKQLNTRNIRIFSFWREKEPARYEVEIAAHLRRAAAVAEKEGMLLLLENEMSCNGGTAAEVARLVRRVDSPGLRALWDPGNEQHGTRIAYPDGYREVKELLAHVHLKDARVDDGRRRCVPIGRGHVAYLEQIRALEADGYRGPYILETHYVPEGGTKMDGTKQSLEGLRALLRDGGLR